MPLDYATLRLIWWILLGALLIGFAVMDGFDLGIGMLLHRVARQEVERRVVLNVIGPVWEGNQIWLILGGGAIFAAWPMLYSVSFSGFYFAMLIILFALILRPIGFKYRGKIDSVHWRKLGDISLFLGGFIPALFFGVAVGNVLQGVPFYFDHTLRVYYTGNVIGLLNPFALLCGLISVAMLSMHGAIFLTIKTEQRVQGRAIFYASISAISLIILFALAGLWVNYYLPGYKIINNVAHDGPSNPLYKHVITYTSAWMNNYSSYPLFMLAPLAGFLNAVSALLLIQLQYFRSAFVASALSISGIVATAGMSMFPFILPSSTHPNMSLTIWDASSSQFTLFIMLIATIIFLPIIIIYTSWVYYVLRGKVSEDYIKKNTSTVY